MNNGQNEVLVIVKNLVKYFPVTSGLFLQRKVGDIKAVDGVSFQVKVRETLGLVGESGCGKTTTGRCLLQLLRPTAGQVIFGGVDLCKLRGEALRRVRREAQIIFQDPYGSLDPRLSVGRTIGEPIQVHNLASGKEYRQQVEELLRIVGLNPAMADRFPHEFSGGQRQRIGIARALAVRPKFIVCDEPVSALDVSIQAQIINLLEELQAQFNLTYLFISHDLAVVRHISDRIAVMYLGKIVEISPSQELYEKPLHPYTQSLLSAVPIPNPSVEKKRRRIVLRGDVPNPRTPPPGCRFHPRCFSAKPVCSEEEPVLRDFGSGHEVACHLL